MVNNNLDDLVLFTENPGCVIIDVRSESEFELDHIPGSINFPVLNDDERKEVGTIYKKNPFTAKQLGARLISSNISKILQKIEDLIEEKSINPSKVEFKIYCWRGGMRSRSLFIVMEMIGYKVSLIKGGYKEYRKGIINYLSEFQSENLLVIHGLSGSGKTEILEILEKEHFGVINLEKLANHKGSFLGENPGGQPSQKNFESYLVKSLIKCKNKKCIIMEGESRKIGKIHLNSNFYNLMKKGRKIWIELPIEVRAERLALEYNRPIEYLISRINLLNRYISKDLLNEIIESLNSGDKLKASFLLLQNHYDPIYRNYSPGVSKERKYCLVLNTEIDINHVFQKLKDFIEKELNCAETF